MTPQLGEETRDSGPPSERTERGGPVGEAGGGATKVVPCEKWKGSLGKAEIDTLGPPPTFFPIPSRVAVDSECQSALIHSEGPYTMKGSRRGRTSRWAPERTQWAKPSSPPPPPPGLQLQNVTQRDPNHPGRSSRCPQRNPKPHQRDPNSRRETKRGSPRARRRNKTFTK